MVRFMLMLCLCYEPLISVAQGMSGRILADSLFIPWEIIYGPDDHLWFTQKNGYVCRMDTAGAHIDTLLHEPATITIRESGMLGMALHPDIALHPFVFVAWEYMRHSDSAIFERIVRYTYDASQRKLVSPFVLIDSIPGGRNHNGCRLVAYGTHLYRTIADAADTTLSQNRGSINGKILRFNFDGSVPADNQWPGSAVWSTGHRNVQGLVMANGRLYASEHGANTDDEINIIVPGANYGWPFVRGYCDLAGEAHFCADSAVAEPIEAWTPTIAPCGIDYYEHRMFPALNNSLLLTTLKDKTLWQLSLSADGARIGVATRLAGIAYGRLRDLCISPEGKIYVTTSNSNPDGVAPFVDKIIELTATETAHHAGLAVFPNPANTSIFVSLPAGERSGDYFIADALGRKLMTGKLLSAWSQVPISALAAGHYVFHFDGEHHADVHLEVVH